MGVFRLCSGTLEVLDLPLRSNELLGVLARFELFLLSSSQLFYNFLCLPTYISANPVNIIQNIFGGGDVQRDNIAIANLEIRTADLLAAKAELERQQSEEKVKIGDHAVPGFA